MSNQQKRVGWTCAALSLFLFAGPAVSQQPSADSVAQDDRIAELERTVSVLADELERTRRELAVPDEDPSLASRFRFGPAASKVYNVASGLSIGGYGEGYYRKLVDDDGDDKDRADLLRLVLYTGYKFSERILFNAEIEFEHATTGSTESSGGGSVSVEFANLDFMLTDWANIRAGLLLVPMGIVNKMHEPTFYYGVNRPEVERQILPSTWRENGVGLFGTFFEDFEYEAYVINGLNAEGFRPGGLRGGRQKGNRALAEHLAFVASLDWTPTYELLFGGSIYYGKSGQNQNISVAGTNAFSSYDVKIPETATTIWEIHGQYESHGLHVRSLLTMAHLGDTGDLSRALSPRGLGGGTGELSAREGIGGTMLGTYGEIAYDVWPLLFPDSEKALEPFFRIEYYDTQMDMPSGFKKDRSKQRTIYTFGMSFYPIPNVVIKADYRNRVSKSEGLSDEFNMGIGFVF